MLRLTMLVQDRSFVPHRQAWLQSDHWTRNSGQSQSVVLLRGILVKSSFFANVFLASNRDKRRREDGAGMACVARDSIQKVGKDPLINLATGACRQVNEADATLSRGGSPTDLAMSFHPQAGESQLKAQADTLLLAQRADGLHRHAIVVEVADNSTIGLIEGDVG